MLGNRSESLVLRRRVLPVSGPLARRRRRRRLGASLSQVCWRGGAYVMMWLSRFLECFGQCPLLVGLKYNGYVHVNPLTYETLNDVPSTDASEAPSDARRLCGPAAVRAAPEEQKPDPRSLEVR